MIFAVIMEYLTRNCNELCCTYVTVNIKPEVLQYGIHHKVKNYLLSKPMVRMRTG